MFSSVKNVKLLVKLILLTRGQSLFELYRGVPPELWYYHPINFRGQSGQFSVIWENCKLFAKPF